MLPPDDISAEQLSLCTFQAHGRWYHTTTKKWVQCAPDFFQIFSNSNAGAFERLPDELLARIGGELDLKSLLNFRQASAQFGLAIIATPEYRLVFTHGLGLVHGLRQLENDGKVQLRRCFELMMESKCGFCDESAIMVFLPRAWRICASCMKDMARAFVVDEGEMTALFSNVSGLSALRYSVGVSGLFMKQQTRSVRGILSRDLEDAGAIISEEQSKALRRKGTPALDTMICFVPWCSAKSVIQDFSCTGCAWYNYSRSLTSSSAFYNRHVLKYYPLNTARMHISMCKDAAQFWDEYQAEDDLEHVHKCVGHRLLPGEDLTSIFSSIYDRV